MKKRITIIIAATMLFCSVFPFTVNAENNKHTHTWEEQTEIMETVTEYRVKCQYCSSQNEDGIANADTMCNQIFTSETSLKDAIKQWSKHNRSEHLGMGSYTTQAHPGVRTFKRGTGQYQNVIHTEDYTRTYRENETAPTCSADGGYDEVVFCNFCEKEISRKHVTIIATGHDWGEWKETKPATDTEAGLQERVCKNDPSHKESKSIPMIERVGVKAEKETAVSQKKEKKETTQIIKKDNKTVVKKTAIKSLEGAKKAFRVRWKRIAGATGYQVQYSADRTFRAGKKTVTVKGQNVTSKKIGKLKTNKKYYVRVRPYIVKNGKRYYSDWSACKAVRIK